MKNNIIVNIPTGTRKNYYKAGLYVTNIIMQELSDLFQLEQYYAFNVLDSYNDKEKYLDFYLNNLKNLLLKPDKILIDKEFELKDFMDYLVKSNLINSKVIIHRICDCGRVDITDDFDNPRTKLFDIIDGKKICKICGTECKEVACESLFLSFNKNHNELNIYPQRYENCIEKQIDFFSSINYLISKERNTGITYEYNEKKFNIDIDFVNYLMVAKENARKKIVVSSMHLTRHQVITYMINNLFYPQSDYTIFLHPYLINQDNTRERCFDNNAKINPEINIDELLFLLTIVSNGNKKDEYKWNMDFYTKLKKFVENNPKKYKLIKEILQSNIERLPYNYHELDSMLSSYREILQTIYLKKMGDDEDELRKRIHNECHKKLYIKR